MMIFYKSLEGGIAGSLQLYQPIVVIDYTRSDEQWSTGQILQYVFLMAPENAADILDPDVWSLQYAMSYTHSGLTYGKALKTQFNASITNAPIELMALLNIQQYTSSANIEELSQIAKDIVDPQVVFPTGGFVMRGADGNVITRKIIIFSANFDFDNRRVGSTLNLRGAQFDDMVIRLNFKLDIKPIIPLVTQLTPLLLEQGIVLTPPTDPLLAVAPPVVARYYQPATLANMMADICSDNNITYTLNNNVMSLISLAPGSPPIDPESTLFPHEFSFNNYVKSNLMSTFKIENYASATFEAQATDVDLFSSVIVHNDSGKPSLFTNMTTVPGSVVNSLRQRVLFGYDIPKYRFYVMEYTLIDSREKTSVTIKGSNNWLIANFKLDNFLENKVYLQATAG